MGTEETTNFVFLRTSQSTTSHISCLFILLQGSRIRGDIRPWRLGCLFTAQGPVMTAFSPQQQAVGTHRPHPSCGPYLQDPILPAEQLPQSLSDCTCYTQQTWAPASPGPTPGPWGHQLTRPTRVCTTVYTLPSNTLGSHSPTPTALRPFCSASPASLSTHPVGGPRHPERVLEKLHHHPAQRHPLPGPTAGESPMRLCSPPCQPLTFTSLLDTQKSTYISDANNPGPLCIVLAVPAGATTHLSPLSLPHVRYTEAWAAGSDRRPASASRLQRSVR